MQQPLHCLQCVEEVVELSTLTTHVSAQGVEVEGTFRDALKLDAAKLPLLNI